MGLSQDNTLRFPRSPVLQHAQDTKTAFAIRKHSTTMRLIHPSTLTLHEFMGDSVPDYTILSHTLSDEEVTLQDIRDGKGNGWALEDQGSCAQVIRDGYEYVWLDTCCIDNTSSAELSEAINSMFQWYQNAHVCYAYLSDVPSGGNVQRHTSANSAFRKSRWFCQDLSGSHIRC
jgi:hypothetical protein